MRLDNFTYTPMPRPFLDGHHIDTWRRLPGVIILPNFKKIGSGVTDPRGQVAENCLSPLTSHRPIALTTLQAQTRYTVMAHQYKVVYQSAPFSMTLNDPQTQISRSRQNWIDASASAFASNGTR